MARIQKAKVRNATKPADDKTQRKLSFYLTKSGAETPCESKSFENTGGVGKSSLAGSHGPLSTKSMADCLEANHIGQEEDDLAEIPPTPDTSNRSKSFISNLLCKSINNTLGATDRRNIFVVKTKSESDCYPVNKRPKLSRKHSSTTLNSNVDYSWSTSDPSKCKSNFTELQIRTTNSGQPLNKAGTYSKTSTTDDHRDGELGKPKNVAADLSVSKYFNKDMSKCNFKTNTESAPINTVLKDCKSDKPRDKAADSLSVFNRSSKEQFSCKFNERTNDASIQVCINAVPKDSTCEEPKDVSAGLNAVTDEPSDSCLPLADVTARSVPNRACEMDCSNKLTSLRTPPKKSKLKSNASPKNSSPKAYENKLSTKLWPSSDKPSCLQTSKLTRLRTPPKTNQVKSDDCRSSLKMNANILSPEIGPTSEEPLNHTSEERDWEGDISLDFDASFCPTPEKSSTLRNRCLVPPASTPNFTIENIQKENEGIHLTLKSAYDSYTRYCLLKGYWCNTFFGIGDHVTVISEFDGSGYCCIDDDKGFIVPNSDILISSTTVTSTMFCTRKSVLGERFRGWDSGNQAMLFGNIVHSLFQRVAQSEPKSAQELKAELANILKSSSVLHELYGLGISKATIEEQALPYLTSIFSWIKQYQSISPSPLCQESKGQEILAQVNDVQDIEENIWCTKYGIKGKIDLTVGVKLHKRHRKESKTMPLELKTGKTSFSDEHQGQVILYSLMMSERLEDPGGGLLLYLSEGPKMKFIEATHNKARGLIQLRNELAYYLKKIQYGGSDSVVLPDPISRSKICQKCPYLLPCTLFEDVFEMQRSSSAQRSDLVKDTICHLTAEHKAYFSKWYLLLQEEYQHQYKKGQKCFWTESAATRESKGNCFANMSLESLAVEKIGDRFSHTFFRSNSDVPLTKVGLQVDDFVSVSSITKNEICITMGSITSISETTVSVLVDRDLSKRCKHNEEELYRLDLNRSLTPFDTSFKNVLRLMLNNERSATLRKCLIEGVEPAFKKGLKRELADKLKPYLKVLNVAQQRAVLKLLMAEDYILLQGMPGTGKTATIVALVRVLVMLGYSVLLTSYTHSAVDNILLRLCKFDVSFVRLGQLARIHPDVKEYSSEVLTQHITSVEELQAFYKSVPVVATTSLGLNHSLFKQRSFDYCIVDEASQILQTACLGPLFHSKVFVLVGDSKQLPPISNSKEAREKGICESLFSRLESPNCTFELNIQYRMNCEIMRLCNELTYNGKLVCGSRDVASATLQLNDNRPACSKEWCHKVFSMELPCSVLFLDTDLIPNSSEVVDSSSVSNPTEIDILVYITSQLVARGVSSCNIGIISFYRKQVQLLHQKLQHLSVEVKTVDQFQGRDKYVVIISCVRSSDGPTSSEILMDERRLNVAITRAKHKLVLVGSKKTLQQYAPFEKLLTALDPVQVVTLPQTTFPLK